MMSFRGIIGYYFYYLYSGNPPTMWFNEIEDHVAVHIEIGLQSPVFSYDSETFLWFIDFNKVGTSHSKAPFEEVLTVSRRILDSFQLKRRDSDIDTMALWDAYTNALGLFYRQRVRPEGKKELIPTIIDWEDQYADEYRTKTRNFLRCQLKLK